MKCKQVCKQLHTHIQKKNNVYLQQAQLAKATYTPDMAVASYGWV